MIDTHAHLDACAESADELVARAKECLELDKNWFEIDRMTAVFPSAGVEGRHAGAGVGGCGGSDYCRYGVIELNTLSNGAADVDRFHV